MARGGARPNSGPKKGTKYRTRKAVARGDCLKRGDEQSTQDGVDTPIHESGLPPPLPDNPITPLEYMLRVLNDPSESKDKKEKMAALAAPFCHPRAGEKGKKQEKADAAQQAGKGRFGAMSGPKVVNLKQG